MIMMVICFVVLFYAIGLYNKSRKRQALIIFYMFLSGCFHLVPEEWMNGAPINKFPDFALLYFLYVCVRNMGSSSFYRPALSSYKTMNILLVYIVIEFIATVMLGNEQFMFALKTFRTYILLGSYLLVAELDREDVIKLVKQISIITLITTLLYLSQPVIGLKMLHHASIGEGVDGISRYRNIPYLAYFFLIYFTVKLKFTSLKSVLYLLLFIAALLLTQHRGIMIGYVMAVGLYLIISRNSKRIIQYAIIGILVMGVAGQYLENRFNQDNTSDDISNVLSLDYRSAVAQGFDVEGGATFSFRVLLLMERIDYLVNNPKYLLTGVGVRHEDSPNTSRDFDFVLGTRKPNPVTGQWEPCQISSADLAWLSPLMRFGLIGLILFAIFTLQNMKILFLNRKSSNLAMSAFLFYMLLFFISFKNDFLFSDLHLFLLYLLIAITQNRQQNYIENESLDINLFKGI